MQTTPSDKVQVTTNPLFAPPNCVVCGVHADTHRKFIDFNFNMDYYGAVYFCEECVVNVMCALDYRPVAEIAFLENINIQLQENLEKVKKENEQLRVVVDSFRNIDWSKHVSDPASDLFNQDPLLTAKSFTFDTNRESEDSAENERKSNESDTERGPENSNSTTESEQPGFEL